MEELKINAGTGAYSPNVVEIDENEYESSEYPVTFEIESQFIWMHWQTSYFGFDKGFTGKVERIEP